MADDHKALVGRVLMIGAVVLAVLAVLCWTGTLPVDPGARNVLALAFGVAAAGDALIGLFFLTRSRES
jgi:hypothetical protein